VRISPTTAGEGVSLLVAQQQKSWLRRGGRCRCRRWARRT
jgi:hypothetical protein